MIKYRPHAEEAVERRGLVRGWIEEAVLEADWTEADPRHPERTRSFKVILEAANRVLRVVHWREGGDIVVLTAHFDRNAASRRQVR